MLLIKKKALPRASGAFLAAVAVAGLTTTVTPAVAMGQMPGDAVLESLGSDSPLPAARKQVRENPSDPKAHYALAELLRKAGRAQEAGQEYLQTTELDPSYYLAYHQLSTINADQVQLDEAINRLSQLKDEKPKDLMLRVALSEILEKRAQYYQGARVLVDMVYQNAVPDKYLAKVNARIHYLLVKARDSQEVDKASGPSEEELDTLPPPLPEATLHHDVPASRLKESRVMRGVGHAPLLP